jgi:hypothetical protein
MADAGRSASTYGKQVILDTIKADPAKYLAIVASKVPGEIEMSNTSYVIVAAPMAESTEEWLAQLTMPRIPSLQTIMGSPLMNGAVRPILFAAVFAATALIGPARAQQSRQRPTTPDPAQLDRIERKLDEVLRASTLPTARWAGLLPRRV